MDWRTMLIPELGVYEIIIRTVLVFFGVHMSLRLLGGHELNRSTPTNTVLLFLMGAFAGRAVLGADTSLTGCVLGLLVALGLNRVLATLCYRSRRMAALIEGPVLRLVADGKPQLGAMRQARYASDMLLAQLRLQGHENMDEVLDAYLERSGNVSFILRKP